MHSMYAGFHGIQFIPTVKDGPSISQLHQAFNVLLTTTVTVPAKYLVQL